MSIIKQFNNLFKNKPRSYKEYLIRQAELENRRREIFHMKYVENMSIIEIAMKKHCSDSLIEKELARAREQFLFALRNKF